MKMAMMNKLVFFIWSVWWIATTTTTVNAQCQNDADCLNGGTCQGPTSGNDITHDNNDASSSFCRCINGFTGPSCQVYCPLACQNGGTCKVTPLAHNQGDENSDDNFTCQCRPGWKGLLCNIRVRQCPGGGNLECLNGGICYITSDIDDEDNTDANNVGTVYGCRCPHSHQGNQCETPVPSLVTCPDGKQTCVNGGQCVPSDDNDEFQPFISYTCACPNSHAGSFCEFEASAIQADRNIVAQTLQQRKRFRTHHLLVIGLSALGAVVGIAIIVLAVFVQATARAKSQNNNNINNNNATTGQVGNEMEINGTPAPNTVPLETNEIL